MSEKFYTLSPELSEAYESVDQSLEKLRNMRDAPVKRSIRRHTGRCDRCDILLTFWNRHTVTSWVRSIRIPIKRDSSYHPDNCYCKRCKPSIWPEVEEAEPKTTRRIPKVQEVCSECLEETDRVKFRGGRSERLREMKKR